MKLTYVLNNVKIWVDWAMRLRVNNLMELVAGWRDNGLVMICGLVMIWWWLWFSDDLWSWFVTCGHGLWFVVMVNDLWSWFVTCGHGLWFVVMVNDLWSWLVTCGHGWWFVVYGLWLRFMVGDVWFVVVETIGYVICYVNKDFWEIILYEK